MYILYMHIYYILDNKIKIMELSETFIFMLSYSLYLMFH